MIKEQRIDNVCLVNAAGELKALAAREWFKVWEGEGKVTRGTKAQQVYIIPQKMYSNFL